MENKAVLVWESIVTKLASSFPEDKQKEVARNMFLVMNTKSVAGKNRDDARKLNAYEALSYVMACEDLGLNPVLNHVIMLEDQFYITLQGHLQNAHKTGQLIGLTVDPISDEIVSVEKWDWNSKKNVQIQTRQFKYKCTIKKRIGTDVAEFSAVGVSDLTNVAGGEKKLSLQIEQMAEARAMRRCLARAFPVGLSNYEDVLDAKEIGLTIQPTMEELTTVASKLKRKEKAIEYVETNEVEPIETVVESLETNAPEGVWETMEPETDETKITEEVEEIQTIQEPTKETPVDLTTLNAELDIARAKFSKALADARTNPCEETEKAKMDASAEVVRINRLILSYDR